MHRQSTFYFRSTDWINFIKAKDEIINKKQSESWSRLDFLYLAWHQSEWNGTGSKQRESSDTDLQRSTQKRSNLQEGKKHCTRVCYYSIDRLHRSTPTIIIKSTLFESSYTTRKVSDHPVCNQAIAHSSFHSCSIQYSTTCTYCRFQTRSITSQYVYTR